MIFREMKTSLFFRNIRSSRSVLTGYALAATALSGFVAANAQPVPNEPSVPAVAPPMAHVAGSMLASRVVLVARPLDSNHEITAVRFLLDGATLAECGPPGRYVWETGGLRAGRHVVQVQAFDGERFVGQSEPYVVYTGNFSAVTTKNFDVPFHTYEFSSSRVSAIAAPRLSAGVQASGARIAESGNIASGRLATALVEVYLNGVKQEFAPAARIASTEEMTPVVSKSKPRRKNRRAPKSTRIAGKLMGIGSQRTVWLPARPLLERLGARVSWQSRDQTLVAVLNIAGAPRRILLCATPGRAAQAEVGGRRIALATPVRLADNAIMVPLAFCREALELRVQWQKETSRVEMFTPITPA